MITAKTRGRKDSARALCQGATRDSDCVLVSGFGKSGSKRLLRILDLSPTTHCRNEPYNLCNSPFRRLCSFPRGWVVLPDDEQIMGEWWDEAVRWTIERAGERDHLPPPSKDHFYPAARRLGLVRLLSSRKARKALGIVAPSLRKDEWLFPRWIANKDRLLQSTPVIKVNVAPAMTVWVLKHRPRSRVLHLVRHPAAVLHSWLVRYWAHHDGDEVRLANVRRLETIGEIDPAWGTRFGDVGKLSAGEAELWYWCYVNETIHEAGRGLSQYELVRDEDIARDGLGVARRLYDVCDIRWDETVERTLSEAARGWRQCTTAWRDLLEPCQIESVERILHCSNLDYLWDDGQIVSRIDYTWRVSRR